MAFVWLVNTDNLSLINPKRSLAKYLVLKLRMKNIEKLISQIIPKLDIGAREHEWFNNDKILSDLTPTEYEKVEKKLIIMLQSNSNILIGETLVKMRSTNSLKNLKHRLKLSKKISERIKWAIFINDINNGDNEMEELVYKEFQKFNLIYEAEGIIFYDLIKFKSNRINNIIKSYKSHKYFLVSHHAKEVLKI